MNEIKGFFNAHLFFYGDKNAAVLHASSGIVWKLQE